MSDEFDITIRFPHVDCAGIVYYPRYIEIMQDGFPDLPLFSPPTSFDWQFMQPSRLGDQLTIRLEIEKDSATKKWSVLGEASGESSITENRFVMHSLDENGGVGRDSSDSLVDAAFTTPKTTVSARMVDRRDCLSIARYFELLNVSIEAWFEHTLDSAFHELHIGRKVAIPTAAFRTRCQRLPEFGEAITMTFQPVALGNKSMTFDCWLCQDQECLVETRQVIVFAETNVDDFSSIPIPADIRSAFTMQMES